MCFVNTSTAPSSSKPVRLLAGFLTAKPSKALTRAFAALKPSFDVVKSKSFSGGILAKRLSYGTHCLKYTVLMSLTSHKATMLGRSKHAWSVAIAAQHDEQNLSGLRASVICLVLCSYSSAAVHHLTASIFWNPASYHWPPVVADKQCCSFRFSTLKDWWDSHKTSYSPL